MKKCSLGDLAAIISEKGEEIREKQAKIKKLLQNDESAMAVIQKSVSDGTFSMEIEDKTKCRTTCFTYGGDRFEYYDWYYAGTDVEIESEIAVFVDGVLWTDNFFEDSVFKGIVHSMWDGSHQGNNNTESDLKTEG